MTSSIGGNIASQFLACAALAPSRPALRIQGVSISYGDLARRAGKLAAALALVSSKPDQRVGLLAKRSPEAYAGALGAAMAGFAYVPIDTDLPIERQLVMLKRAKVSAIITDAAPDPRLAHEIGAPILSPEALFARPLRPLEEAREMPPDAPAYLMFTSGTTGAPKAVVVTVGNVLHFLGVARDRCPLYPDDRASQFYELTFDLSIFDVFHGLGSGACLHVVPASQRMAPAAFIQREALTVWSSVPSVIGFLRQLKLLQPGAFPSLRFSMFCGEPLQRLHVDAWREAAPSSVIDNHYGPTEATVACMGEVCGDPPRTTEGRGVISIGKAFPGMRAAIVDEEGHFKQPGETGELALSGPQVAAGYFDDPDLTARRFRPLESPTGEAALYYLTGDLAYEDTEGYFHHLGRVDHQVKILGRRVELEEIEAHLRAASGCESVAVPWPLQEGAPVGVVAFIADGAWTTDGVLLALERSLPSYMIPRQILRKSELPVGPNGKLSRAALALELTHAARVAAE